MQTKEGGNRAADLILAAGGILEKWDGDHCRICVVYREIYGGEWCLPKGKQEVGEDLATTALREVAEETGCQARHTGFAGVTHYYHGDRPKVVLFWRMTADGPCHFQPSAEVRRIDWLTPGEALAVLSHRDEIRLVSDLYQVNPKKGSDLYFDIHNNHL